jgi:hypothetical protein
MSRSGACLIVLTTLASGCWIEVSSAPGSDAGGDDAVDPGDPDSGTPTGPYADLDEGCAPIFHQSVMPDFHLTIAPDQLAAIDEEFRNPQLDEDGVLIDPPYHPVELRIELAGQTHQPPDVMVRLSGNTSWLQAILFDADPKMQFQIAFNKVDPEGRFQGLRKLKLDMPRNDWTFLEQRVATAWLRGRAGIPAPCTNSARLFINGAYYGLYATLEQQDKSFLDRVYGDEHDGGDLWKGGRVITTNEDDFTWEHITQFWEVTDLAGLDAVADVDTSMIEWASEAVIGDPDGYNNGRANFYVYDHPGDGRFVWLANDLDVSLDWNFLDPETTPVLAPMPAYMPRWELDWHHYLIALNDPAGLARYVAALRAQLPRLDPDELTRWIDDWHAQIADAAAADPHRPFGLAEHQAAVADMRTYAAARADYLGRWLACHDQGGPDADGDTYDMCHDCNDADPAQSPGDVEVCDSVDNDCDGRVDDGCPPPGAATRRTAFWAEVLGRAKISAER